MEINTSQNEWDLSPLFKSDDDPAIKQERKAIKETIKNFVSNWRGNRDFTKSPEIMKRALDEYESLFVKYGTSGKEGYYFWLRSQKDQNDSKIKGKYQEISDFSTELDNELQFFKLLISKIPKKKQGKFLQSKELKQYRHFLEIIFKQSAYLLSEKEERILNLKQQNSYEKWVKMTSSFLSKEEREVLGENNKIEIKNFSEINNLINSQNKKVRDSAAEAFNDILKRHADVAEAEINAILADKKVNDELRGMKRPDFSRHLSDDIESEVVDALIDSVAKNFKISNDYYKLKAKLLGVKKLGYHERNVPYGKIDKKYSFNECTELIARVFSRLDAKFQLIFSQFLKGRQIDIYPKKGKKMGAFCVYWTKSLPTYILTNYTERLQDVLTLAHEAGHGINNELIKEKQNSLYFETPLATAEVASTFMEDFILEELSKEVDDEIKLALIINKLNEDISTIFRQIACYRFEQEIHKEFRSKGYLSKEEIGNIFRENMKEYMGDFVEHTSGSENCWVSWSHIRNFFYVYSYASGLLISKVLQKEVRKDKNFIEKVKEFLSSGTSDSPRNIFIKMGINIKSRNFWDEGLDEIKELLNEAEFLAKKLNKI